MVSLGSSLGVPFQTWQEAPWGLESCCDSQIIIGQWMSNRTGQSETYFQSNIQVLSAPSAFVPISKVGRKKDCHVIYHGVIRRCSSTALEISVGSQSRRLCTMTAPRTLARFRFFVSDISHGNIPFVRAIRDIS